jgi:ferric-dicitrate binding protein FerR (iron transport regulator)
MSLLDEVAERDGWRCWVCDEPVDADMSVNDPRGPSVDSRTADKKAKVAERLAHRACNTRKGAVKAVVPWSPDLFVVDPAPIAETVERLRRKGGREVVARCPSRADADAAATWLVDRLSRFAPDLPVAAQVEPGGGQFLLAVRAG